MKSRNVNKTQKSIHVFKICIENLGLFGCKDRATMARWFAEEKYGYHANHGRV